MSSKASHAARIRRATTGDREAFDELARENHLRVVAVLRQWRGALSSQDIDDVLQEATLRAFRAMGGFESRDADDPDAFFSWLSGIALNVARENVKREERRRHDPLEGGDEEPPESGVTPSRAMRREERLDRLEESLRALPADYREIVKLVRLEGVPVKEVARRLDKTPNAISRMLLRASRKLRESFGDTGSLQLPERRLNLDDAKVQNQENDDGE